MEWFEKLEELRKENPSAKVITMVGADVNDGLHDNYFVVPDSIHVGLEKYVNRNNVLVTDDYLWDEMADELNTKENENLSDEEFDKLVEEEIEKIDWKQAIFVTVS